MWRIRVNHAQFLKTILKSTHFLSKSAWRALHKHQAQRLTLGTLFRGICSNPQIGIKFDADFKLCFLIIWVHAGWKYFANTYTLCTCQNAILSANLDKINDRSFKMLSEFKFCVPVRLSEFAKYSHPGKLNSRGTWALRSNDVRFFMIGLTFYPMNLIFERKSNSLMQFSLKITQNALNLQPKSARN